MSRPGDYPYNLPSVELIVAKVKSLPTHESIEYLQEQIFIICMKQRNECASAFIRHSDGEFSNTKDRIENCLPPRQLKNEKL